MLYVYYFFCIFFYFFHTNAQPESLLESVEQLYLNTYFSNNWDSTPGPTNNWGDFFRNRIKPQPIAITPKQVASLAFNKIIPAIQTDSSILTLATIKKMELIQGAHTSTYSLYAQLFKPYIYTQAGHVYAIAQLMLPTTDSNLLEKRQDIISFLVNNSAARTFLNNSFKKLAAYDTSLWSLWHTSILLSAEKEKKLYFSLPGFRKLNQYPLAFEIDKYLQFGLLTGVPLVSAWSIKNRRYSPQEYSSLFTGMISGSAMLASSLKEEAEAIATIHTVLIDIASYFNEIRSIISFLKDNNELIQTLPTLQNIIDIFETSLHSQHFNTLISLLNSSTFIGKNSLFSLTGRVKVAYSLIKLVKDELLPALQALAQLETYMAVAQLYSDHTDNAASYCIVDFSKKTEMQVALTDFWNPMINTDIPITNSITLPYNRAYNIILTGPNTAGKTTILKGLLNALILAQTFGIAPAKKATLSLFSKLNCFMDIQDNMATGTSLFQAEVDRAQELLKMVQSTPKNEYCFTIIDEIFSSTSAQEGESAAYMYAKKLGQFANTITIIATHYKKLIDLEKETQLYKNFSIEILRNQDNSLTRTFKLNPYPSFMNIAADILKAHNLVD